MHAVSEDDQRVQRWLHVLRDGDEPSKIAARRGLARVFEQRGMLKEAIELLEHNLEAGVRSAETLRWLSRLYQAQGDEARSLEAAITASQQPFVPLGPEPSETMEAREHPRRPQAIRPLLLFVVVLVGLGIIVGAVLWMLMPVLKP